MFGKLLHFLIYIEVKGVLSAVVWVEARTVMAECFLFLQGLWNENTRNIVSESKESVAAKHHGVIASSILFSLHQLTGIFVFIKKENDAVSAEENNYFLRAGFYVGEKNAWTARFKRSPPKIHLIQTFRSRSIWNISCSSAGAAGIKDSYGYIWWERSTPLLSCIRRSD